MLGPLDEFPVHQLPRPIAWPGSSDRNFYDRSYFNAHDRTGNIFFISGIGYYPNLGVKDAFVLIRRGDTQTAVHLSDSIDQDRLNQNVNGYRIEVSEPLRKLRLILDETEGIAADLTWEGLFDVVQEQPHILRSGNRVTLNAQRFAQLGSWSGRIAIDGQEIAVDPATWIGSRDRSWGIRPIGEPEPAGRPADPPFEGMWWLYVPMAFDDFAVVLIIQEEPNGFRSLNDCTRIWRDGRVEQIGTPEEIYDNPASPFVYDFLGAACRLPGVVAEGRLRVADWETEAPHDAPQGADNTVSTLEDTAYTFASGDFGS